MKFEDKMNRAFKRSVISQADWNGGAMSETQCEFSVYEGGKRHVYEVRYNWSHDKLKEFGYGSCKNKLEMLEWKSSNAGVYMDVPDWLDKSKIEELKLSAVQPDEKVNEVFDDYKNALKEFYENFK